MWRLFKLDLNRHYNGDWWFNSCLKCGLFSWHRGSMIDDITVGGTPTRLRLSPDLVGKLNMGVIGSLNNRDSRVVAGMSVYFVRFAYLGTVLKSVAIVEAVRMFRFMMDLGYVGELGYLLLMVLMQLDLLNRTREESILEHGYVEGGVVGYGNGVAQFWTASG